MKSKVQLLLTKDIGTLGKMGDLVDVASGYARNYLLPRKLATPVSDAARKRIEKQKVQRAEQETALKAKHQALAKKLEGMSVSIPAAAGPDGKLFGSVTQKEIVQALAAEGVELEPSQVAMESHLKELGVHTVPVKLDAELSVPLKVWVVEK